MQGIVAASFCCIVISNYECTYGGGLCWTFTPENWGRLSQLKKFQPRAIEWKTSNDMDIFPGWQQAIFPGSPKIAFFPGQFFFQEAKIPPGAPKIGWAPQALSRNQQMPWPVMDHMSLVASGGEGDGWIHFLDPFGYVFFQADMPPVDHGDFFYHFMGAGAVFF